MAIKLKNLDYQLILASASPRRQELLKNLGYDFQVKIKTVEESFPADLPIENVAGFLAEKKSKAFIDDLDDKTLIITADTVVILENEILGKPLTLAEAEKMLLKLSGKQHSVMSGVCLLAKTKKVLFSEETLVFFKNLTSEEIDYYLANFPPLDKAGAYGIQEWIGMVGVQKIEGCFYNVMGLPLAKLYENLQQF